MDRKLESKILPFTLAIVIIALDQITKLLVVRYIPYGTIGATFIGDFLRIVHISNTGVAFSVGANWSETLRHILFAAVPIVVIAIVIGVYFRNDDFNKLQRWAIMGIIGGGIGNLIDRIFRAEGVVDFIDVKFYGLFGLERWPTFNVADAAVVVCGILLFVSFIITFVKDRKEKSVEDNK